MTENKVLVDTNILVYAHDLDSEKNLVAAETLKKILASREAVLSIQNLAEFCRVSLEKTTKTAASDVMKKIVRDLSNSSKIIYYDAYVIESALEIKEKYELHFFDSLLAAAMLQENVKTIMTENEKDFKKISWLKVINPFKKQ